MNYINNNNNTQSDRYFHDNKNQLSNKNYFKRLNNSNQEYFGTDDPDYSNLLKQYKQDTITDEFFQYKLGGNFEDFINQPAKNCRDLFNVTEHNPNENWLYKNEKCNNSVDSSLNQSDDEALENYLNDLAKNYDDIDRRIRNAEKFVNQIEESQDSNFRIINSRNNSILNEKSNGIYDKNGNYVTELRVNISDNLVNNKVICNEDQFNSPLRKSPKFLSSIYHHIPNNRNESLRSRKSSFIAKTNMCKSNYLSVSSNQNYMHLSSEFQSPKSRSSSKSNSNKLDLEYVNIPPPQVFSSNYFKNDTLTTSKKVQTNDYIVYRNNVFSQYSFEDKSVQTISPGTKMMKLTTDECVGTESKYFKPRLKLNSSKNSITTINAYESDIEFSDSEKSISAIKSSKKDFSEIIAGESEEHNSFVKSALSKSIIKTPPNKSNFINLNQDSINRVNENVTQTNLKNSKSEIWKRSSSNSVKFNNNNKILTFSPNHDEIVEERKNLSKIGLNNKIDFEQENIDNNDSAKNASLEIQRLLENLGTHLQASMSLKKTRQTMLKSPISSNSSSASFWDNPLHKTDLISSKITPVRNVTIKPKNSSIKVKRSNNMINSELQAICKTIEKNKKFDNRSNKVHESSSSEIESLISGQNNLKTLRSESLDLRPNKNHINSPIRHNNVVKKAASNLNLSGDNKFPSHFKVFRSFELNPYDDIIKAHLNPVDRRVKSVAAKNGCKIVIDGPINSYDPLSCQAFRNKITYRCTVAGPNKENLDKCMNYLKETFPNTFLKLNARNG